MLDGRVSETPDPESLVAFVERLAGSGSRGPAVRAATSRITGEVRSGRIPAGLRTLAASLESPVPPQSEADDGRPDSLLDVVGGEPLVVLSGVEADELARALAELTGYGMRVLLTGHDSARLDAVRSALPAAVAGRVVDRLPALAPSDLSRLRRLLATVGADAGSRAGQQLPEPSDLPSPADVAGCCERAGRTVAGAETAEARVVPGLLRELDADRRDAVTQVARCVRRSLGILAEAPDADRLREVVGRLVHGGLRTEFEELQGLAARQRDDRARFAAGPVVEPLEPLPDGADDTIRGYLDFLEAGGRSRTYFRPQAQRDAEPALSRFRVDGDTPHTLDHVAAIVNHLDLARRDDEIARLCTALGLALPRSAEDLPAMTEMLDRVAATARSVGALRHDVLFLQQDSPVAVPDLPAAERVAVAIVDYDEHGDPSEAGDELERLAAGLESAVPVGTGAPEHAAAVAALRAHDPAAYTTALEELGRARREVADRDELSALLGELATTAPDLARAWATDATAGTPGFGLLHPVPVQRLLSALPPADAADLVVVLGAGALQADDLLLTTAAPRLLAVVGSESRAASSGTTLVEVLNQASARFLRGTGDRTPAVPPAEAPEPADAPIVPVPAQQTGAGPALEVPAPRTGPPASATGSESLRPSTPSAMAPAVRED
ncbi:hypothetical protein ACLFMI_06175 [Pseudonocardia nantongensis]|uniref:hypothetical protein n=1 Tax=Pseudonocardia nantongensis TaxID=1181885 RepID=UPI0039792B9B